MSGKMRYFLEGYVQTHTYKPIRTNPYIIIIIDRSIAFSNTLIVQMQGSFRCTKKDTVGGRPLELIFINKERPTRQCIETVQAGSVAINATHNEWDTMRFNMRFAMRFAGKVFTTTQSGSR